MAQLLTADPLAIPTNGGQLWPWPLRCGCCGPATMVASWPEWRPGTEREDARMEFAFSVVATAAAIWLLERLASGEDL